MANPSLPVNPTDPAQLDDSQMWESLKLAIAESSGFQRWQLDACTAPSARISPEADLDALVHQYLRETLETLAY